MKCEGRPTSCVAIVDRAFDNLYCTKHIDIVSSTGSGVKGKG
jgi:hypothetical protein